MQIPLRTLIPLGLTALLLVSCGGKDVDEVAEADFTDPLTDENKITRPPNVITESENVLLQIKDAGTSRLLPTIQQARIRRDGSLRWLEVSVPTTQAWQVVRGFWQEQGFGIEIDLPEAGFLETTWQQDRSQVLGTGLSRYFDIALGVVNDTGVRHKFRARIEPGPHPESSNIFVSHRVIEQGGIGTDGEFIRLPSDPILEVEMMRRLMIAFRLPEESVATLEDLAQTIETSDLYETDGNHLTILRSYDESWQLLGVALDRSGFTVLDRDRTAGVVSLQVADPTIAEEELGFFRRMFNRGQERGEVREVELTVKPRGIDLVEVTAPANDEGEVIIRIIAKNL